MSMDAVAKSLALDCLAVGWEVDDIGALVAEATGFTVPDAWGIAYEAKTWEFEGVDERARQQAVARLSEFGIAAPGEPPAVDASPSELLAGAIDVARELAANGHREGAVARTLVDDYFLPPHLAAAAAAVAATDPR
jgi:hypothetical protein